MVLPPFLSWSPSFVDFLFPNRTPLFLSVCIFCCVLSPVVWGRWRRKDPKQGKGTGTLKVRVPRRTGGEGGGRRGREGFYLYCNGRLRMGAYMRACVLTDLRASCKTTARFPGTRVDEMHVRVRLGLGSGLKVKGGLELRCLLLCALLRVSVCCGRTENEHPLSLPVASVLSATSLLPLLWGRAPAWIE